MTRPERERERERVRVMLRLTLAAALLAVLADASFGPLPSQADDNVFGSTSEMAQLGQAELELVAELTAYRSAVQDTLDVMRQPGLGRGGEGLLAPRLSQLEKQFELIRNMTAHLPRVDQLEGAANG